MTEYSIFRGEDFTRSRFKIHSKLVLVTTPLPTLHMKEFEENFGDMV